MQITKFKNMFVPVGFILFVAVYFSASQAIVSGVKSGLQLCCNVIIPSLYPFMVVSCFIASSRYADAISRPFVFVFRLLNIKNRRVMTYCMLSIIGGFATGGYFLNVINCNENIPQNMQKILPVMMSLNSPSFVITAVGVQMLGSLESGVMLYVAVVVSAFITAFFMSFILPFEDNSTAKSAKERQITLTQAVKNCVDSILDICGVVIVVSALCKVVELYSDNLLLTLVFSLFCEVTAACNFVTQYFGGNLFILIVALCILPVSSYMQLKSSDKKGILNLKPLILSKAIQIPIAVAVMRILVNLFPTVCNVYASGDITVNRHWNSPVLSFYLIFVSVCFVVFFDKKTGLLVHNKHQ